MGAMIGGGLRNGPGILVLDDAGSSAVPVLESWMWPGAECAHSVGYLVGGPTMNCARREVNGVPDVHSVPLGLFVAWHVAGRLLLVVKFHSVTTGLVDDVATVGVFRDVVARLSPGVIGLSVC